MAYYVNLSIILACIAVTVILLLSVIAAYYRLKLRKLMNTKNFEMQKKWRIQEEKQLATQNKLLDDCRFVAKALTSGQCDLTEACLRIITLRDHLPIHLQHKLQFDAMQAVYDATWKLPTHQAYKDLDKQTRFKQDSLRLKTETQYNDQAQKEALELIVVIDKIISSLS